MYTLTHTHIYVLICMYNISVVCRLACDGHGSRLPVVAFSFRLFLVNTKLGRLLQASSAVAATAAAVVVVDTVLCKWTQHSGHPDEQRRRHDYGQRVVVPSGRTGSCVRIVITIDRRG